MGFGSTCGREAPRPNQAMKLRAVTVSASSACASSSNCLWTNLMFWSS